MSSVSILGFMQSLVNNPAGEEQKTPHSDNNSSDDIVSLVANKLKFGPGASAHTSSPIENVSHLFSPKSGKSDSLNISGKYKNCKTGYKLQLPETNHTYSKNPIFIEMTKRLGECPLDVRNGWITYYSSLYAGKLSPKDREEWSKEMRSSRSANRIHAKGRLEFFIENIKCNDLLKVNETLISHSLSMRDLRKAYFTYSSLDNVDLKSESFMALHLHIQYRESLSQQQEPISTEAKTDSDITILERNPPPFPVKDMIEIFKLNMKANKNSNYQTSIDEALKMAKNWMKSLESEDQQSLVKGIETCWPRVAEQVLKGG